MQKKWYAENIDAVLSTLDTDPELGLSNEESNQRLQRFGGNTLEVQDQISPLALFLQQFKNPLIVILAIGAIVSFFTGHRVDAIAITIIIFVNTLIAFGQELKAQKGMEALRELAAPTAHVKRNGIWIKIPANDLVPGDIIKISSGDIIAADIRIIESHSLFVDESALTGESEPVEKNKDTLADEEIEPAEQANMGFMTTIVTFGSGLGVVTETGMKTEVGHIADLMVSTPLAKTPMQQRMHEIAKVLVMAAIGVVFLICLLGLYLGMSWFEILNTGISLSVAAIPEGLPTVISIVLTMGSTRMVKNNALVKQFTAIETLGSTTVICSDKTGTLTQNQMQVIDACDASGRIWKVSGKGLSPEGEFEPIGHTTQVTDSEEMSLGLTVAALCNDAVYIQDGIKSKVIGNPTEGALIVSAIKAGLFPEDLTSDKQFTVVKKFPFDSVRKMSSVIIRKNNGKHFLAVKGAPDVLLSISDKFMVNSEIISSTSFTTQENLAVALDSYEKYVAQYQTTIDTFANKALRTLSVGFKELTEDDLHKAHQELEQDITLLGLFGIMDPPRSEVVDAIQTCSNAGIRTIMITGDHSLTATAIAKDIGIINSDINGVVTGPELDKMNDDQLLDRVNEIAVFARVTPEHKLRIVEALQNNNEVVAMTGDGVNDSPALRRADIGVAMGITGTSVAKESGDLILLDDNFSTIVKAVRQGRQIYDNLKKFVRQDLTANVGEVSVILFAFIMMGTDVILPLTPLMILWINLVSDGLPALALGIDPEEKDAMHRKPRKRNDGFFSDYLGIRIMIRGLSLGSISYLAFHWGLSSGNSSEYAQTMAFAMLIFAQLWHLFDARTFTTLFRKNPFTNKVLLLAICLSFTLSLCVIYTSWGQFIFSTESIQIEHLIGIIIVASLPTFLLSGLKEIFKIRYI